MSLCTTSGETLSPSVQKKWCPSTLFRLDENGKVAEHWDALTPLVKETASGRSQTDGPAEVTDLDKNGRKQGFSQGPRRRCPDGQSTGEDHRIHQHRNVPSA